MKKPPTTSIVRRSSVTMPMDAETFKELFGGLPSAPNLLQATKFSVSIHELDAIMPPGWSLNTFKTSTTCRLQPGKPVEIALVERKKVFFDHSGCLRCQGGNGAPVACKDVVRKVVFGSTLLKISFYRERNKQAERKPKSESFIVFLKIHHNDNNENSHIWWQDIFLLGLIFISCSTIFAFVHIHWLYGLWIHIIISGLK